MKGNNVDIRLINASTIDLLKDIFNETFLKKKTSVQRYIDKMSIDPKYDRPKMNMGEAELERYRLSNILAKEQTGPTKRFINTTQAEFNKEFDTKLGAMKILLEPVEQDPNGLDMKEAGAKADLGKPDLDLLLEGFSKALEAVAVVSAFGADKYSRGGWLSVPNGLRRYSSALLRHMFYYKQDELIDKDSGLTHLAHAAWNGLAILELTLRQEQNEKLKNDKLGTEGNCI